MRFTAPMRPYPKERPRVSRHGTYMSKVYVARRDELRAHFPSMPLLTMPLRLDARFLYNGGRGVSDFDNVLGGLADALNGHLIGDDRQILSGSWWMDRQAGEDRIEATLTPHAPPRDDLDALTRDELLGILRNMLILP